MELQQTQDQIILRQNLVELGELTAGVAHEIRNPLNFMKNFSEASEELVAELREAIEHHVEDLEDDERGLIVGITDELAENIAADANSRRACQPDRAGHGDDRTRRRQAPARRHQHLALRVNMG